MSEPLVLFLGCSFARDKVGADGYGSEHGISDWELAEIVRDTIIAESRQRITVKIAKDPFDKYIPTKVREELVQSDLMLCLFTRRTPIPNSVNWVTSTFVASEASAYLMQMPSENATHNRLFALAEEGVDTGQLGMAFPPGSKTVPRFSRTDIEGLKREVRNIVNHILGANTTAREDREYLSLHKTVTICRDGRVKVETWHRFRFTTSVRKVCIPHTIWRVRQDLPPFHELLDDNTSNCMLRALPIGNGSSNGSTCKLRINPKKAPATHHQYRFEIEVVGSQFEPGDELHYAVAWEYPGAFSNNSHHPNSVGLRCGDRGVAQDASLTIQFERDWEEPDRLLEEPPTVWLTNVNEFRSGDEPEEFWHTSPSWIKHVNLKPSSRQSSVRFEAYQWTKQNFLGMAKVTFTPHSNYFLPHVHTFAQDQLPLASNSKSGASKLA